MSQSKDELGWTVYEIPRQIFSSSALGKVKAGSLHCTVSGGVQQLLSTLTATVLSSDWNHTVIFLGVWKLWNNAESQMWQE